MKQRKHYSWKSFFAAIMAVVMIAGGCLLSADRPTYAAGSTGVLEAYDAATDIGKKILPGGEHVSKTGRNQLYFKAIDFAKNSYNMTVTARYDEDKTRDNESLRFIVAKATDRYYGNEVTIEMCVRDGKFVHIMARPENGAEVVIKEGWNNKANGKQGVDNDYAVRYDNGKVWFYENGQEIYKAFNIGGSGRYINIVPYVGFAFELAKGSYHDLSLWGKGVSYHGEFPSMPSGNGDYADYIGMKSLQGTSVKYENGVLYSTGTCADMVTFTKLPFSNTDTFAWSFELNVKAASKDYQGARPVIRADKDFKKTYQLAITAGAVVVLYNGEEITRATYSRTLGKSDKFGIVCKPDSVSVWVNDVLILENIPLEHDLPTALGMKFENTDAVMQNMHFYYVEETPFTAPEEDPTVPVMTSSMYNGAQFMVVKSGNTEYSYQNYTVSCDGVGRYTYTNVPLPEEASYTYRADVTLRTKPANPWQGPRLLFRSSEQGDIYLVFTTDALILLRGNTEQERLYRKTEVGKTYDVAVYSTTSYVNVWIDGKLIFHQISLSDTGEKTKAKAGVWFESCNASLSNIKLYGKDIVLTDDIFDLELYQNKWFNMTTVPQMPSGNHNYFTNAKLGSGTSSGYDQAFADGVLHLPLTGSAISASFVDQNGAARLNGLRKSDTYVWSSKVKINKIDKTPGENGKVPEASVIFTFRESTHPSGSGGYRITFCMVNNRLELQVWQFGSMTKVYRNHKFELAEGKEYALDMLIGEDWAKIWVDNELVFTAYDLPTYHSVFKLTTGNLDMELYDNAVYQVEQDDAKIIEVKKAAQETTPALTIFAKEAEEIPLDSVIIDWSKVVVPIGIGLLGAALLVVVFLITQKLQKKRKARKNLTNETQTAEREGEQDS